MNLDWTSILMWAFVLAWPIVGAACGGVIGAVGWGRQAARTGAAVGVGLGLACNVACYVLLACGGGLVRHPMYLALLIYSAGQALVLPNWLVGPSYGVAMFLLFAFRVGPEERMMREQFGEDYEAYRLRTKCLVPGVW